MRFHIKIKRKSLFAWIMLAIFSISSAMGTIMFADQTRMNCIERYHYLLSPPFGFRDGPIIDTGIDGVKLHTKGLENELLKIIIGVPSQIDQNESIPIFIAGLRNAKATYVIPENITVELLGLYPNEFVSIDEERYQQKLGSYIFGTAQGIIDNSQDWRLTGENDFSDGRKWISNPQTSSEEDTIPTLPVSHLGYDLPLFNCTFPALKFKATFSIRVTFTWRTPWFEILSQTASQTVQVAPWYEFEKFLQTNKLNSIP